MTLFILDWDNTLLPTYHLKKSSLQTILKPEDQKQLSQFESQLLEVFDAILLLGRVYIVTNAQEGWVAYCVKMFLPRIEPLLTRITVISARSQYENTSNSEWQWKSHTFQDILSEETLLHQVIGMGDSPEDMQAWKFTFRNQTWPNKFIQTRVNPTIKELEAELCCFLEMLPFLMDHPTNAIFSLDLTSTAEKGK